MDPCVTLASMPADTPATREVAVGLIVDDDGRLLLQQRDDRPGLPGRGRWGLFGGHLDPGEKPAAAFLREIEEELGWRPRRFEPATTWEVDADGWRWISHVFAAHLDVPLSSLTLNEGAGMELFAPDELPPDEKLLKSLGDVIRGFVGSSQYRRMSRRYEHLTTAGLLVDADGRFLLQLRDDKPEIINPGVWGTFGGELEPYETPEDGFLREIEEELAWRPASHALYAAIPYERDGALRLVYAFAAPVDVPLRRMRLGEGADFAFFAPDALPERIAPGTPLLIEAFARRAQYGVMRAAAVRQR
jgi:8-oxo-dGTP diphosphatase